MKTSTSVLVVIRICIIKLAKHSTGLNKQIIKLIPPKSCSPVYLTVLSVSSSYPEMTVESLGEYLREKPATWMDTEPGCYLCPLPKSAFTNNNNKPHNKPLLHILNPKHNKFDDSYMHIHRNKQTNNTGKLTKCIYERKKGRKERRLKKNEGR